MRRGERVREGQRGTKGNTGEGGTWGKRTWIIKPKEKWEDFSNCVGPKNCGKKTVKT
jgi:hypothetical protein